MTISQTLKDRISIRAYLDRPVSREDVRDLLDAARFAPSGGNLQPWRVHVVMGASRERLIAHVKKAIQDNPATDQSEISVYPKGLKDPWRARRSEVAEDMYALLNIPRDDKLARLMNLARNFEFFGAPVGLFFSIDRQFDKNQWAHLGMFMQSLALLATERGMGTCMQEAWTRYAKQVSTFLELPDHEQLYCGMSLGYPDMQAPVNHLRSTRIEVDSFTTFLDE